MRKGMVEKRNEELEDMVPTSRGLIFWSRRRSRHHGLRKKRRRRNRRHVNTLMQTSYRARDGEIGRELSQRIPGEESFAAKSRKKSGLQVGRVFPFQPSCQSTNPLHPRAVLKEIIPACEQSSSLRPGQQGKPDRSVPLGKGPLTSSQRDAPGWGRWPM